MSTRNVDAVEDMETSNSRLVQEQMVLEAMENLDDVERTRGLQKARSTLTLADISKDWRATQRPVLQTNRNFLSRSQQRIDNIEDWRVSTKKPFHITQYN